MMKWIKATGLVSAIVLGCYTFTQLPDMAQKAVLIALLIALIVAVAKSPWFD